MPYLIDGHNLIPKLGLRLDSMDDELELVAILQEFARLKRHQVEVYFDGAPASQAGTRRLGTVRAHFVRLGQTADNAIRDRLNKMGKSAKNLVVVSSDHEVQNAARVNQAQFVSAEEFVKLVKTAMTSTPITSADDKKLSASEVDEWLQLFHDKDH
ncbi:MAG: NYN domain-containing protein [Anaerolineales bacterium]|nr:NYN domain-containing protein [Anaerolineales bacterium]